MIPTFHSILSSFQLLPLSVSHALSLSSDDGKLKTHARISFQPSRRSILAFISPHWQQSQQLSSAPTIESCGSKNHKSVHTKWSSSGIRIDARERTNLFWLKSVCAVDWIADFVCDRSARICVQRLRFARLNQVDRVLKSWSDNSRSRPTLVTLGAEEVEWKLRNVSIIV